MRLGHGVLEVFGRNSTGGAEVSGGGGWVADQRSGLPLPQLRTSVTARASADGLRSLRCKLVGVSDEFGHLCIDAQPELLTAAGCAVNREFRLEAEKAVGEVATRWARAVQYVSYPFIVPPGTWIAYDHPDGYLIITVSGWTHKVVGGAAVELRDVAMVGDSLRIIGRK